MYGKDKSTKRTEITSTNTELKNHEGGNICATNGIFAEMAIHIKRALPNTTIPWLHSDRTRSVETKREDIIREIRPKSRQIRGKSKLQGYFESAHGSGSEEIMLKLIGNNEIDKAIASLETRKTVGADGITSEVVKKNQQWAIHMIKVILRNCQVTHSMPKNG